MFKSSEKTIYIILIAIFLLSLFLLFLTNSSIPLVEVFNSQPDIEQIQNILSSIASSTIASIVLIVLIDMTMKRYEKKDKAKRADLVNDKINRSCYKVYFLLVELYKATCEEDITDNDKILNGLFNDIDGFYLQLKKADLSQGSFANTIGNAMNNHLNVNWMTNLLRKFETLKSELTDIQVNFYSVMETERIYKLNEFIDSTEKMRLCIFAYEQAYAFISSSANFKQNTAPATEKTADGKEHSFDIPLDSIKGLINAVYVPSVMPVENFISENSFKDFTSHLKCFMQEFSDYTIPAEYKNKGVTFSEIKKEFFISPNAPQKGSALNKLKKANET